MIDNISNKERKERKKKIVNQAIENGWPSPYASEDPQDRGVLGFKNKKGQLVENICTQWTDEYGRGHVCTLILNRETSMVEANCHNQHFKCMMKSFSLCIPKEA